MMYIEVLTLFPEVIEPFFKASIVGRAAAGGVVELRCTNIRDYADSRHRTVDDKPFGGGAGMLLMCGPVFAAVEAARARHTEPPLTVLLTPQGERYTQKVAHELAASPGLILVCGHYEGFDERIRIGLGAREISVGDYVLSGGEAAALVVVDSVVRLLPGALGCETSTVEESFVGELLEYPQYTRPREFRGMSVPDVLLSGDHARIAAWRREQQRLRTRQRRPDLFKE